MPRFDGALMRARRQKLNLSAPDLADLSKVPYASVQRFETGRTAPFGRHPGEALPGPCGQT